MPGFEGIFAVTGLMAVFYLVLGPEETGGRWRFWIAVDCMRDCFVGRQGPRR